MAPTSVRELDDDSIAFLVEAYLDQIAAPDPRFLCGAPLEALCAAVYGPARCGPGGDADTDKRLWKYACGKLGLTEPHPTALTTGDGASVWRATFRRTCLVPRGPNGHTILMWASSRNYLAVVRRLIALGVDPDVSVYGATPLMQASYFDYQAIVEALLEARADVNIDDDDGASALLYASARGNLATVELLLRADADVDNFTTSYIEIEDDFVAPEYSTPLIVASAHGHLAVVEALLAANPYLEARDVEDKTALLRASFECHASVVRELLAAGAEVDVADGWGRTSLMLACAERSRADTERAIDTVRVLLAAGADVDARDKDGRTALTWARSVHHFEIVDMLRSAQAYVDAVRRARARARTE